MQNKTVAITNIGILVSGDIEKGILKADTILIKKGKIAKVGNRSIIPKKIDQIIDANGMTVTPGLIDSHTHPFIGDWTPRLNMTGYMEKFVHGGVTTIISQQENHVLLGVYNDKTVAKSLAILAKNVYEKYRPGGLKVEAGPIILEGKLDRKDFLELKKAGVWRIGEIGGGGLYTYKDIKAMLKIARSLGFHISAHCGGVSQRVGGATMTADDILRINPDVAVHVNGGPTALPYEDIKRLVKEANFILEIIHNGNFKMLLEAVRLAKENHCLRRIIIGSDMPTGRGLMIVAILNVITIVASIGKVNPATAVAMATGNTADAYHFNTGKIERGRSADLVIMDSPIGSAASDALESLTIGDVPAVAMVLIDGEIVVSKGQFTAPPKRFPKVIYH